MSKNLRRLLKRETVSSKYDKRKQYLILHKSQKYGVKLKKTLKFFYLYERQMAHEDK